MSASAASLKNISLAEKEKIVSLPMRAGLWMQRQRGGRDNPASVDDLDGITLIDRLRETARTNRSAFVQEIFEQTLELKNRWLGWSMETDRVPEECMDLCILLKKILSPQDYVAYRMAVFAIAESLALPAAVRLRTEERSVMDRMMERLQELAIQCGVDERHFSKIHPDKQDALNQIGRALNIRPDGTSY